MKRPPTGELQRRGMTVRLGSTSCIAMAAESANADVGTARLCMQQIGLPLVISNSTLRRLVQALLLLLLFFPECRSALCLHQLQNLLPRDHAATPGPDMILSAHITDALWMLRGHVMHLGAIGHHIVEFPRAWIFAHQLPFTDANGCIALVFPEQRTS